jgi:hypothetical protein
MPHLATFVQAVDKLYYKNPIIQGDKWFLFFPPEGDTEICVKSFSNSTVESARRRVVEELSRNNIKGIVGKEGIQDTRPFPPDFEGMEEVYCFNVNLTGPIPVPGYSEGSTERPLFGDFRIIGWSMRFRADDILTIFTSERSKVVNEFFMSSVEKIRKSLRKQFPELKSIKTIENQAHFNQVLSRLPTHFEVQK